MKKQQLTITLICFLLLSGCKSESKKQTKNTSSKESRVVNVTYTLEADDHDETHTLRTRQDIIHTYGRSSLELDAVVPPYIETIAGLTVYEGFKVKLEFDDATKCTSGDECKYEAKLYISVNGEVVSSGNFNCSRGEGSGFVEYTFD